MYKHTINDELISLTEIGCEYEDGFVNFDAVYYVVADEFELTSILHLYVKETGRFGWLSIIQ